VQNFTVGRSAAPQEMQKFDMFAPRLQRVAAIGAEPVSKFVNVVAFSA
jgi:hypothetical protein